MRRNGQAVLVVDARNRVAERAQRRHGLGQEQAQQVATARGDLFANDDLDPEIEVRRDGSGRDLGYPGGTVRPPRFEEAWSAQRGRPADGPDR